MASGFDELWSCAAKSPQRSEWLSPEQCALSLAVRAILKVGNGDYLHEAVTTRRGRAKCSARGHGLRTAKPFTAY